MRLKRLPRMTLPELAYRGRQQVSKRLDRLRVAIHANGRSAKSLTTFPPLLLHERFRETVSSRFFPGTASEEIPVLFRGQMAQARDRVISTADSICAGRFDLLGYRELCFKDPIDWHLDPISGRRSPRIHWSRLDPLDATMVGDSKVVWELNRHQWLIHLGQAYRLTGNERYAEVFVRLLGQWLEANPRGVGINWSSSLEIALRLISWCWALVLFRTSQTLSSEFFVNVLSSLATHASHVERHLSYYFSPNTHLTGEALGLIYAGLVFPELRDADRWRRTGAQILVEQSERQVLSDGVHFELATCYQRYTVDTYLHLLILAKVNGLLLPRGLDVRVQQMLDFLMAIRRPDCSVPQIGDADGGRLVPLMRRAPDDFRDVFSTAATLFNRADYAWAAESLAPETVWLLGPDAARAFEALSPAPPVAQISRRFGDGGYIVMRSAWDREAHQLIFDAGPLGCPVSAGHGHADLLSIQCSVFGEACLVDPGTFGYTGQAIWRDYFRGSAAHNTVMVDGAGQADPAGPFRWRTCPRPSFHQWLSNEAVDFADASHDGYCRGDDPVVHRRRVLFVKPRYWVVVDDLDGKAEHSVDLRFQFAPMRVTVNTDLWARACGLGKHGLLIRPFAATALKAEVHEGDVQPIQGWISPDYGRRRPAPVLTYSAVTRLPLRIVTLLFPTYDPFSAPPAVTLLESGSLGPVGIVFDAGRETVRFDTSAFSVHRG